MVGRFLEHSRIFYMRWGEHDEDEMLLLSSADWMSRNMTRRIELAWPICDPVQRQRVLDECLVPYLHDERGSWLLGPEGRYHPLDAQGLSAQQSLLRRYSPRNGHHPSVAPPR